MDYHVERHNLISSNVANADTPGYRPRELVFARELNRLQPPLAMERTRTEHLPLGPEGAVGEEYRTYEETWSSPGNDGNYVRLEHEMSRMQANGLRYRASTQMVSQHLGLLRYSISGRG
jgi:flagellar basal-body rod protein FlgB